MAGYVFIGLAILAVLWVPVTFNKFVRLRNMMTEAWSGIDVQLKRRHDLIPNLVETVKGYSQHEKGLFDEIARTRSQAMAAPNIAAKAVAENALTQGLRSLIAVAEAYPDLKANQNFLALQGSLSEAEEQLQLARRYYNGTTRNFNIATQSFPGMLLAGMFGFGKADFFELESADERATPTVKV